MQKKKRAELFEFVNINSLLWFFVNVILLVKQYFWYILRKRIPLKLKQFNIKEMKSVVVVSFNLFVIILQLAFKRSLLVGYSLFIDCLYLPSLHWWPWCHHTRTTCLMLVLISYLNLDQFGPVKWLIFRC